MDYKSKQGWKVLIPHTAINPDARKYLEDRGNTIILYPSRPGVDLKDDVRTYQPDAIIIRDAKCDRAFFEAAAPALKALARYGAGYDGVDLNAADAFGVTCVSHQHCTRGACQRRGYHRGCENRRDRRRGV